MHSAPAVSYPVGRSLWAPVFMGGVLLLNFMVLLFWLLQADGPLWPALSGLVLALGAGMIAFWNWQRPPAGRLQWDGRVWQLHEFRTGGGEAVAVQGQVTVRLDVQRHLLVEWRSDDGRRRWLDLSRVSDPVRWGLLRCALVAASAVPVAPAMAATDAGRVP